MTNIPISANEHSEANATSGEKMTHDELRTLQIATKMAKKFLVPLLELSKLEGNDDDD